MGAASGSTITTGTGNTLLGAQTAVGAVGAIDRIAIGRGMTNSTDSSAVVGNGGTVYSYMSSGGVATDGTQSGFYSMNPTVSKGAGAITLTANEIGPQSLVIATAVTGGGDNWQIPLATAIIAKFAGMVVGASYYWMLRNEGAASITLTTNTGITLGGSMVVATVTCVTFKVTMTAAATVTVQRVMSTGL